jgi:type I restriction enzyme, S subunit
MTIWQEKQVKELGDIVTGATPSTKRKDFYGGSYNLISPTDLDKGKYITSAHKQLTKLGFEQCRSLPKNSILVGCIGNVGKLGIVGDKISATNQQINALICNDDNNAEFIYYCFEKNRKLLKDSAVKTTIPILNKTNFGNLKLSVPILPVQRRISHILSIVQKAIEQQEKIIQTTTEMMKTLMNKLFTEGLRGEPQKQTEIGPIPESWEDVPFEKLATLQRGKDLTRAQFRDGLVPVAGSNGVIGFHDTAISKAPGVTVGRSGSAGKVTVYDRDFWPHNTTLYVRDFHGNNPHFVGYYLKFLDLSRFKTGASVPTLDRNSFKTLPVIVPSLMEQEHIVEVLDSVGNKIEIVERKKTQLQSLFRTLLHELMTAKRRVDDLEFQQVNENIMS